MEESIIYIVIEIQAADSTAATIIDTYPDRNTAEQKYHQILAAAAVSSVQTHSAVMLTQDGTKLKGETYHHGSQSVPGE